MVILYGERRCWSLDFDREKELENAGIDVFVFSLMNEDERREDLEDAFHAPDDYDLIEYDTSFNAWSNLQNAGSMCHCYVWSNDPFKCIIRRES